MRLSPPESRAYTYNVVEQPSSLPVGLGPLKEHLNIRHNLSNQILMIYLASATKFAEDITGINLMLRTFETYRDAFPNSYNHEGYYPFGVVQNGCSNKGFEIRKTSLKSVESITYTNSENVITTVDSDIYYCTKETLYSEIVNASGKNWPCDDNGEMQNIVIRFTAGISADECDIEPGWKMAILSHVTSMWTNRGDCSSSNCGKFLPDSSKMFYESKRVLRL